MAFNHISQNRPVDQAIKESQKKLSLFSLISKGQVKVWKATVASFFIAGFVGALALSIGLDMGMKSQAAVKPDLITMNARVSSQFIKDGDSVNIFADVKNRGGSTAGASYVRFCVDNDNCLNSTTGRIGNDQQISSLAMNKSTQVSQVWKAVAGTHTLTVCADATKKVSETNEKNNCANIYVTVNQPGAGWPDLITQNIIIDGDIVVGSYLVFRGDIKNQGGADAGQFAAHFCVDNANCLNTTAGRVGGDLTYYQGLKAGETINRQTAGDVWAATIGTHTVYFCADVMGVIKEPDENNNCSSKSFTIAAHTVDFITTNVTIESGWTLDEGEEVTFSALATNQGNTQSGPYNSRFCMDNANCLNTSVGIWQSDIYSSGLCPQCEVKMQQKWTAVPGYHKLTVCADVNKQVSETNENNNCGSFDFSVEKAGLGDLVSQELASTVSNPTEGALVAFKGYVKNEGPASATSSNARFCVNNSDCLNSTAGRVGADPAVYTLASQEKSKDLVSDNWVAQIGTHTIYLCADVYKGVKESNESNNCTSISITVNPGPDLISTDVATVASGPFKIGDNVYFKGNVKNQGTAASGSFSTRFCVDNSNCLNSTTGQVGGDKNMNSLGAGQSISQDSESSWTATAGSHAVYLCADIAKAVNESNESNNCGSYSFTVSAPDLVSQNITLSNPYPYENDKVTFSGSVKNSGDASAGSFPSRFCVDNSNCLNTTTGRVGYNITISSLSAGSSTSLASSQWIATLGTHTAYLCADVAKVVTESNEGNNCASAQFSVTSSPPVQ